MVRTFAALLAATLAGPYAASFLVLAIGLGFGIPSGPGALRDLAMFPVLGTLGLLLFGLPTLALAGFAALLLHLLGCRARGFALATGAALGGLILAFVFAAEEGDPWIPPVAGSLSGAVCGWIYWRIATGGGTESAPEASG